MIHASTRPMARLNGHVCILLLYARKIPFTLLFVCWSGLGNIGICTLDPLGPYVRSPLDGEFVKGLATHDTRQGGSERPIIQFTHDDKVTVLSVNPPGETRRVNALTTRLENQLPK